MHGVALHGVAQFGPLDNRNKYLMKLTNITIILVSLFILHPALADDEVFPKIGSIYLITYPDKTDITEVRILLHGSGEWYLVEHNDFRSKPVTKQKPEENTLIPIRVRVYQEWINFSLLRSAQERV